MERDQSEDENKKHSKLSLHYVAQLSVSNKMRTMVRACVCETVNESFFKHTNMEYVGLFECF